MNSSNVTHFNNGKRYRHEPKISNRRNPISPPPVSPVSSISPELTTTVINGHLYFVCRVNGTVIFKKSVNDDQKTYKYNSLLKINQTAFDEFYEVTFFKSRRQVPNFYFVNDFELYRLKYPVINVVDDELIRLRQPTTVQKLILGLFLTTNNDLIIHPGKKTGTTIGIALALTARTLSTKVLEIGRVPNLAPIGLVVTAKNDLNVLKKVYENITSTTGLICSTISTECDILIIQYKTLKDAFIKTTYLKFIVFDDAEAYITDRNFPQYIKKLTNGINVIKIFTSKSWTEDRRDYVKPYVDETAFHVRVYSM